MVKGGITKESFLAYFRCKKLGMYMKKLPHLANDDFSERILENEIQFKERAFQIICSSENEEGTRVTRNKTFRVENGIEVTFDALIKRKNLDILIESVCSTDMNDGHEFVWLAYKYYLIKKANIKIDRIYIIKISEKFEYGVGMPDDYLYVIDITKKLQQFLPKMAQKIEKFNQDLQQDFLPESRKKPYCLEPIPCPFRENCWKDMPSTEESAFEIHELSSIAKFNFYWHESYKFEDIPKKRLTDRQWTQVKHGIKNKPNIEKDKIAKWLNQLNFEGRVWYLYIGCAYPVDPFIQGARPFARLPFHFSLSYQFPNTTNYTSFDYVAPPSEKGKIAKLFFEELSRTLSINTEAPIVVYDTKRTEKCLRRLERICPEYKLDIEMILKRMVDIKPVFYDCWYYQPNFKGFYDLLTITPKILPNVSFQFVPISSSFEACEIYLKALYRQSKISQKDREAISLFGRMNTHCQIHLVNFLKSVV